MAARVRPLAGAVLAAAIGLLPGALASAQSVTIALVPGTLALAPDSVFTLELRVTQSGSAFNAFDATVGFDTAAVRFQATSPVSQQIGSLITAASCNSPFHVFTPPGGSDSVSTSVAIFCNGVSVTGPGQLYKLKFKASHVPADGWIRIRSATFYNAGVYVAPQVVPLYTSDAHVVVGTTGVGPGGAGEGFARLVAGPNPARGAVMLVLAGRAPGGGRVEIHDALGRLVRRLDVPAGLASVRWDGRDDAGRATPSGVYLVRWSSGGAVASGRVVHVP